jgi:hypothetical protein
VLDGRLPRGACHTDDLVDGLSTHREGLTTHHHSHRGGGVDLELRDRVGEELLIDGMIG